MKKKQRKSCAKTKDINAPNQLSLEKMPSLKLECRVCRFLSSGPISNFYGLVLWGVLGYGFCIDHVGSAFLVCGGFCLRFCLVLCTCVLGFVWSCVYVFTKWTFQGCFSCYLTQQYLCVVELMGLSEMHTSQQAVGYRDANQPDQIILTHLLAAIFNDRPFIYTFSKIYFNRE